MRVGTRKRSEATIGVKGKSGLETPQLKSECEEADKSAVFPQVRWECAKPKIAAPLVARDCSLDASKMFS